MIPAAVQQVTDLQGLAPRARALVESVLASRLGPVELAFDFHREWNGGWRCAVEVTGRGTLHFVLFHTPSGALLALPHPLPARWADAQGFAAEDGARWTFDAEGQVIALTAGPGVSDADR